MWWFDIPVHCERIPTVALISLSLTSYGLLLWPSKESACNAGDLGLIPGLERSPGEGKGYLFQYSGLENPMDRGAWWATVHAVTKSRTRLSDFHSLILYTFLLKFLGQFLVAIVWEENFRSFRLPMTDITRFT